MQTTNGSASRILVIDDDAIIRATLTEMLEDQGYSVASAANGWEALNHLRTALPPHLIVLDLMMPVMDGWEFRRQQLKDPDLASIPVIVLSSLVERRGEAADSDAIDYLPKGSEPGQFLALVAEYCRRRVTPGHAAAE
jgi:CheY-like chemotaxis protein